jgi:hypothetical protein
MVVDVVKSPLLHTLPELALERRMTLPPEQNVVEPEVEIVGVGGVGLTVTTVGVETAEVQPSATA